MSKLDGIENNTEKVSNRWDKSQYKSYFEGPELFDNYKKYDLNKYLVGLDKDWKHLANRILSNTLYEILLDVIENNTIFTFSIQNNEIAEIFLDATEDEEFKREYKRGRFNKIDFVKSNFTAYLPKMYYKTKSGYNNITMNVGGELAKALKKKHG